ncbi:MAG: sigma-70 family RNA polymerase sigma factor [Acidimicrobiia bacterium]|nr:sigma-70 family RNA polymerase sigma factor [Acidimicrobiia bacterium]
MGNPMEPAAVEPGDEAHLVRLAQAGDKDAFQELIRQHQHGVFTLALRLVNDREQAADIAQDAFIRAWRGLPRFRGDAAFKTWIHRITVNAAWTFKKRAKRHLASPLDDASPLADPTLSGNLERAGENLELRERLRAALDQLPRPQRTVVVLKDIYGWSHGEIAEALGITISAAKVRLHRAHHRLRDHLGGER